MDNFDSVLDQFYSSLLAEHSKLLGELKNCPDKFSETERVHSLVSVLMKTVLKLKNEKHKQKMRE